MSHPLLFCICLCDHWKEGLGSQVTVKNSHKRSHPWILDTRTQESDNHINTRSQPLNKIYLFVPRKRNCRKRLMSMVGHPAISHTQAPGGKYCEAVLKVVIVKYPTCPSSLLPLTLARLVGYTRMTMIAAC